MAEGHPINVMDGQLEEFQAWLDSIRVKSELIGDNVLLLRSDVERVLRMGGAVKSSAVGFWAMGMPRQAERMLGKEVA